MFDWMFMKEPEVVEPTLVDEEIERLYKEWQYFHPYDDEYQKINARLKELIEIKNAEKATENSKVKEKGFQVSGDTVVKCVCMVGIGVLIVFKEELVGPIASKALTLVTKFV